MKKIQTKHPRTPDSRKGERGFSLIELLIAMAVVLILVGGLAIAGERSLQAGRETSAAQSIQSFVADETTYQRSYGGFSPDATGLEQPAAAAQNSCTADGEIPVQLGITIAANAVAGGTANGGYWLFYDAAGAFNGSACGGGSTTAAPVETTFEITANPVDHNTKSFCGDSTGTYYLPAGTAMANAGKGCLIDNTAALPVGQ